MCYPLCQRYLQGGLLSALYRSWFVRQATLYAIQGYAIQGYAIQGYTIQGYTIQGYTIQGYTIQGYTIQGELSYRRPVRRARSHETQEDKAADPFHVSRPESCDRQGMCSCRPSGGLGWGQSSLRTSRKAFWGTCTLPICFMRFLPRFCFSRSLRLRLMSPP